MEILIAMNFIKKHLIFEKKGEGQVCVLLNSLNSSQFVFMNYIGLNKRTQFALKRICETFVLVFFILVI